MNMSFIQGGHKQHTGTCS